MEWKKMSLRLIWMEVKFGRELLVMYLHTVLKVRGMKQKERPFGMIWMTVFWNDLDDFAVLK